MRGWQCKACCKSFQSYGKLLEHRQTHSVNRPFKCRKENCYKSFPTLIRYQLHYRWHVNKRLYCCASCRNDFMLKSHLLLHKCRPLSRERYKCHICWSGFKEVLSLAHHLKIIHPHFKRKRRIISRLKETNEQRNNHEDNKILLKITAGKSMTIISPSKGCSHQRNRRTKVKKSKHKHKDDVQKNGIVLSIKKGLLNMSSTSKSKISKQSPACTLNGVVNRVVEPCSKGGNLKMKIKTLPEKSASPTLIEKFNTNSYPSSPIYTRKPTKSVPATYMSDTEIKNSTKFRTGVCDTSKMRNGIVIVKDKTGKLLAEQLQSAKAKKRDNVFDSFSDVGMWKVMPSPRPESTLDNTLKLRFSPQKPLRLDSGLDSPCEKSKYMDIGVLKSHKLGNYSEDSDVFEGSPGVEKDSDHGLQNVNDSGIEILSSSSCNRSNGNSVRSVILDENSPTYFPTEDSLLSIDSPANENQLKTEHTVCVKCGGILMETNNNAQSPRKCQCSASLVNSPTQAPSPTKSGLNLANHHLDNEQMDEVKINCLNKGEPSTVKQENNPNVSSIDDSDSDKNDIVMIDIEKDHIKDKISEFEDVEIIRDSSDTENKAQNDLKLRLKLKPKKNITSDCEKKLDVSNSAKNDSANTHEELKCDTSIMNQEPVTTKEEKESTSKNVLVVQNPVCEISTSGNVKTHLPIHQEKDSVINSVDLKTTDIVLNATENKNNSHIDTHKTEIKKKPLFKVKKSPKDSDDAKANKNKEEESKNALDTGNISGFEESNCIRKKKPIFKKRSMSGDSDLSLKRDEDSLNRTDTQLTTDVDLSVLLKNNVTKQPGHVSKKENDNLTNSIKSCSSQENSNESEKLTQSNENISGNESDKKANVTEVSNKVTSNLGKTDDEDSLLQLAPIEDTVSESKNELKSPVTKKSCTSPLDLFQQQFLSFLSSNKPVVKEEESKNHQPKESTEVKKSKLLKQDENTEKVQNKKTEKIMCDESRDMRGKERNIELLLADGNSFTEGKPLDKPQVTLPTSQGKEKLSLRKLRTKQKTDDKMEINKETGFESQIVKVGCEDKSIKDSLSASINVANVKETVAKTAEQKEELLTVIPCNQPDRLTTRSMKPTESRSDSLSWLKIFSDSLDNNKGNNKKDEKSPSEEVVDFSADLEAINKKMDVSDDELNALDVDDVFKSKNLSTLQPKVVQERTIKRQKSQGGRPQKARRSIGKFKLIPKNSDIDSENSDSSSNSGTIDLYSNAENDPDFNPFHDSDGDFELQPSKCKGTRRKSTKSKNIFEDSDSDLEMGDSKSRPSGEGKNVSRSKRLKQGQKSCCPCCLGSPGKSSKDHHNHKYKLPKNSRQFVNSSIKLLELQAKIHQLFLSLFPECAELISNSKIGTEEFELLIEEVLSSLESKEINFEGNQMESHQEYVGKLYTCPSDSCNSLCNMSDAGVQALNSDQTGSSVNGDCDASLISHSLEKRAGAEIESHNDKHSNSMLLEVDKNNRTSSNNDTQISNSVPGPHHSTNDTCHIHSAITQSSATIEQLPQAYATNDESSVFFAHELESADTSSCLHSSEHGALDAIESDITITIDLNAAKVSLCRDPKHCLERLQNRIPRLVHCLLPKLKLRKTFFKSMNNLHLLLDLMITSNLPGSNTNISSDEEDVMEKRMVDQSLQDRDLCLNVCHDQFSIPSRDMNLDEPTPPIKEDKSAIDLKREQERDCHISPVERVPLLSKFQDMFEQEIKSHRESLKKDVFEVDTITEKGDQSSLLKAKEVLTTISKFEKMNSVKQKLRPRRDPRLRKRSEAETRKLFVQEKIQNNQHSSIVCHSSPQKVNNTPIKSRHKRKISQNSKESFLSKLNLGGNTQQDENSEKNKTDDVPGESDQIKSTDNVESLDNCSADTTPQPSNKDGIDVKFEDMTETSDINLTSDNSQEAFSISEKEHSLTETENNLKETTESKSDLQEVKEEKAENPDKEDCSMVPEDSESKQKSGEKNIFELMQPS